MSDLHVTLARVQRSIEDATSEAPATETAGLMREVANRVEAFSLFECTHDVLRLRAGASFTLDALLADAERQGPYRSLFLKEGIGYLYAKSALHDGVEPAGLLSGRAGAGTASLPSLHVGMGVCFAEHALHRAGPFRLEEGVRRHLSLWRANALADWQAVAGEPLGFAARVLFARAVHSAARIVARIDAGAERAYWHGVGRGLFFAPAFAVPLCGAHGRAMWFARTEAPSPDACRNMVSGWAWGMTLTNIRHPDLIESALVHASEAAPPLDALRDGVAGALALLAAECPSWNVKRALWGHQPCDRHSSRLWDRLVRPACTDRTAPPLPAAFRYRGR